MERFSDEMRISDNSTRKLKYNLLSFLATAQALHLKFLPITWESARQKLGQGATSKINEVLVNLHTCLAFKRIRDDVKREGSGENIFCAFTNEITVLT